MKSDILLAFLLFAYPVIAQEDGPEYIKNIDVSNGLAHNGVTAILKDSRGFLWISTYDGLTRYDGYENKIYKNTLEHKILLSNRIRTIAEDSKGMLWIGTDEGISLYNYFEEKFDTIYSNSYLKKESHGPIVRKIFPLEKCQLNLCATEGEGLLVFNEEYQLLKQYVPQEQLSSEPVLFHDGLILDDDNFIFSTSVGIIHFNLSQGTFKRPLPNENFNGKSIVRIGPNEILVTRTRGIGVYTFQKEEGEYNYKFRFESFTEYSFNAASIDKLGNIWLGSLLNGILHVNNAGNLISKKPVETNLLNANSSFLRVSCFYQSDNHGCWVGTFNKGFLQFNLEQNPFQYYNARQNQLFGLKSDEILRAVEFDRNRVYVTAFGGGVSLINTKTGMFEPLPFYIAPANLDYSSVLYVDSRNNTWIRVGGQVGIIAGSESNTNFKPIKHSSFPRLSSLIVTNMTEDRYGNIWMATTEGVFKLILTANEIKNVEQLYDHVDYQHKNIKLIRYIYNDPMYDYIWIGTDVSGLIRIKNEPDKSIAESEINQFIYNVQEPNSISSNFVTSIIRLPNGELWIGTERGGINLVLDDISEAPTFVAYSEKDGLSNNVVKNILYDRDYNLWIPTNKGLNKFDTNNKIFITYGKQDGLPFEDFVYPSVKTGNGELLFSGYNGIFFFDPNKVRNEEVLPGLRFGEVRLFNKIVQPQDAIANRILLKNKIENNDTLLLMHDEDVISLEILSLHYSAIENHFIKYKLFPFNESWIEVPSNQRVIHFNGLPVGEYELKVMASNSLGQWTDTKSLYIIIKPPFWITTPAILLYFFVFGMIVLSIIFYILRMNKLRHRLEIEEIEKDKIKAINEAKLQFFSNISHEIKTPLTLIAGPVDMLYTRFKNNADLGEKLQIIRRQSKKMLRLVNQVHDFQRADANLLEIHYSVFCFNDFIDALLTDFHFKADRDKKILTVEGTKERIYVSADNEKLEIVLNNLLNNAFKFTSEGDLISLSYFTKDDKLFIKLVDRGRGIDSEDLPNIFGRFYQSNRGHSNYIGGSGIGLAFTKRLVDMHYGFISVGSKLHEGTSFTVELPILTTEKPQKQNANEDYLLEIEKERNFKKLISKEVDDSKIEIDKDTCRSRIFFVEDNSDIRNFISEILTKYFEVESFKDGKECLDALENEWPDLVISDILMPEINGFELCKKIKSNIKTSHIPVILLTACTTIEDHIKGLEVGADLYLIKPFNVEHLITSINNLLKSRKLLRERFQIDLPVILEKREDNKKDMLFLEKLYKLMAETYQNQELNLDDFARELYLNRTHFYQKVKVLTNKTPFELLKTFRLKKAAELLVQKNLSVNEVYLLTGFKSRTHFSRLFKETYHIPPGKYAEEMLSNNHI